MRAKTVSKKKTAPARKSAAKTFPIVAIGASAGGLDAMSRLLKHLPADTGMAFFYVQHLSPDHPSNLTQLLGVSTSMKVEEATNLKKIEPGHLYVCTPNWEMKLSGGKIKLHQRRKKNLPYLPIDDFFTSVADAYGERAIGIILSGNATDGTMGVKRIRDAGGLTFAQDGSAKNPSMPKSASGDSGVDYVMSPKEIAAKLSVLGSSGYGEHNGESALAETISGNDPHLNTILTILAKETGVDFKHYKMSTIRRRLSYRMLNCKMATTRDYSKLIRKDKKEAQLLYKDLLIHVTSFFRDRAAFNYLKRTLLPRLLKRKASGQPLRIWVPACSTGEEAYSIAMLVAELQDKRKNKVPVQIFASDLSAEAIRDARTGDYSIDDVASVSKERLRRFFTKSGSHYRIIKDLREMCVFATHNLLRDPAFSRMDLISCCNLLIYFDSSAQEKALATLGFALNDGGFLMLGKSESIGSSTLHFTQLNHKFKIYSRKKNAGNRRAPGPLPRFLRIAAHRGNGKHKGTGQRVTAVHELDNAIDSVLLSRYMPACAIINRDLDILKFRGSTSRFLAHSAGNASLNILKMTRPEYAFELANAIRSALKSGNEVKKTGIKIKIGQFFRLLSLEVTPLKIVGEDPLLMVVFVVTDLVAKAQTAKKGKESNSEKDLIIKNLEKELSTTRREMHTFIESQEVVNAELQAANEEIISTNEEFQTLNEELETSKEEIEATNEELISTNQELQMRNDLLNESYSYSEAIIATIHEPMIILDNKLCVKSANKAFYAKFSVSKNETEGYSLFELGNRQWNIPSLRNLLDDILTKNIAFKNLEIHHTFPGIGEKFMLLNAHRIVQKTHREKLLLLAIEDITERTIAFNREKEFLNRDITVHKAEKVELEKAVQKRTRQLNIKNRELENVNRDLTSFTYISSHDLQEPLRKIRNFARVLLEEEEQRLSPDGKMYLQRTYETANRMQSLIQDLLAYSRTKNPEHVFEATNLGSLIDELKNEFGEALLEKGATIEAESECALHVIPFQFRQLMQNLISNSLKFSDPERPGVITITCREIQATKKGRKSAALPENLPPQKNYAHIAYTDNGIGFDELYKNLIFDVFQRLHSQEEYPGTGMGLAICKRIVENHHGVILASGEAGKGARFDIYIPMRIPVNKSQAKKVGKLQQQA